MGASVDPRRPDGAPPPGARRAAAGRTCTFLPGTHSTPQHTTSQPYDSPRAALQPGTLARPTVTPAARGWAGEPARAGRRGSPLQISRINPRIPLANPLQQVRGVEHLPVGASVGWWRVVHARPGRRRCRELVAHAVAVAACTPRAEGRADRATPRQPDLVVEERAGGVDVGEPRPLLFQLRTAQPAEDILQAGRLLVEQDRCRVAQYIQLADVAGHSGALSIQAGRVADGLPAPSADVVSLGVVGGRAV